MALLERFNPFKRKKEKEKNETTLPAQEVIKKIDVLFELTTNDESDAQTQAIIHDITNPNYQTPQSLEQIIHNIDERSIVAYHPQFSRIKEIRTAVEQSIQNQEQKASEAIDLWFNEKEKNIPIDQNPHFQKNINALKETFNKEFSPPTATEIKKENKQTDNTSEAPQTPKTSEQEEKNGYKIYDLIQKRKRLSKQDQALFDTLVMFFEAEYGNDIATKKRIQAYIKNNEATGGVYISEKLKKLLEPTGLLEPIEESQTPPPPENVPEQTQLQEPATTPPLSNENVKKQTNIVLPEQTILSSNTTNGPPSPKQTHPQELTETSSPSTENSPEPPVPQEEEISLEPITLSPETLHAIEQAIEAASLKDEIHRPLLVLHNVVQHIPGAEHIPMLISRTSTAQEKYQHIAKLISILGKVTNEQFGDDSLNILNSLAQHTEAMVRNFEISTQQPESITDWEALKNVWPTEYVHLEKTYKRYIEFCKPNPWHVHVFLEDMSLNQFKKLAETEPEKLRTLINTSYQEMRTQLEQEAGQKRVAKLDEFHKQVIQKAEDIRERFIEQNKPGKEEPQKGEEPSEETHEPVPEILAKNDTEKLHLAIYKFMEVLLTKKEQLQKIIDTIIGQIYKKTGKALLLDDEFTPSLETHIGKDEQTARDIKKLIEKIDELEEIIINQLQVTQQQSEHLDQLDATIHTIYQSEYTDIQHLIHKLSKTSFFQKRTQQKFLITMQKNLEKTFKHIRKNIPLAKKEREQKETTEQQHESSQEPKIETPHDMTQPPETAEAPPTETSKTLTALHTFFAENIKKKLEHIHEELQQLPNKEKYILVQKILQNVTEDFTNTLTRLKNIQDKITAKQPLLQNWRAIHDDLTISIDRFDAVTNLLNLRKDEEKNEHLISTLENTLTEAKNHLAEANRAIEISVEIPEAEQERVKELFAYKTTEIQILGPDHYIAGKYGTTTKTGKEVKKQLESSKTIALGDAHASALKILETAIIAGLVAMPEEKAKAFKQMYKQLVETTTDKTSFRQTESKIIQLIQSVRWSGKEREYVLIGDTINDRGAS
ncbi:MAG: hypothetical protein GW939_02655, partial [Candidatus Magasanikbacteria bacterium]|nr:hypothetical protein [Candidatus Magasanikbacteria bacterium]